MNILLKLKPTSNDIELKFRPKSVSFFNYRDALFWNLWKTCSLNKSGGVFGGLLGLFALNQSYQKIEFERADIESNPKKLTLCSIILELMTAWLTVVKMKYPTCILGKSLEEGEYSYNLLDEPRRTLIIDIDNCYYKI